jgi:phage baseplate assembly protein W
MSDLQLITASIPGQPQFPPQQGNPPFFFGEQTNDLQIDPSNNDFTLVSGLDETVQDVQKILLTEQGTNLSFPLYGTTMQSLIGGKVNPNIISSTMQQQITQALQILFLLTQNRSNLSEVVQTLYSLKTTIQSQTNVSSLLTVIAANGQEITTGINIGNI